MRDSVARAVAARVGHSVMRLLKAVFHVVVGLEQPRHFVLGARHRLERVFQRRDHRALQVEEFLMRFALAPEDGAQGFLVVVGHGEC